MKKNFIWLFWMVLIFAGGLAHAEIKAGSFSIYPFAGGYFFEGNEGLKDSYLIGIRAGYHFTQQIGIEGFFNYVPAEVKDVFGDNDLDLFGYGVEGLYHFMPDRKWVPFVAIGLGGNHYDGPSGVGKTDKFSVDYGAGLKYFITDRMALRADVRHVIPFDDRYNNLLVALGVHYAFGGVQKTSSVETPPTPAEDSDHDGIPDPLDRCPDTPAGWAVDKNGCSLDTDQDGVPDTFDKCPGTAYGVIVDKNGCVPDRDQDGVPDNIDKCPTTPAGVIVDKEGCTADSDNDGVADYMDQCAGTPPGIMVDKNGCPAVKEIKVPQKISMTLHIEFDTAKSILRKKYYGEIKKVADFMKKHPQAKAVIEGHTDNVDRWNNPENNMKLSQFRADSVRQYLIDHFGIDPSRVTAVGYGPLRPIASNDTEEGRKRNRRVEVILETAL